VNFNTEGPLFRGGLQTQAQTEQGWFYIGGISRPSDTPGSLVAPVHRQKTIQGSHIGEETDKMDS